MIADLSTPCDEAATSVVPCGTNGFTFNIPDADGKFFAERVMDDERRRVRCVLAGLREIYGARLTEGVNPACRRLAQSLNRNWSSLRSDYYAYTAQGRRKGTEFYPPGDWRTVLNWSKVRADKVNLPFATLELWRELGELNQRCWSAAWGELIHIVKTGFGFPHGANGNAKQYKKFPGYEQWPAIDPALGYPPGFSYSNLMNHKSDPFAASLARHGRAKALELRLPVLKTRTSLVFGQYVEFDDHDFNQKVMFQKKPMRPSGFMAIEVLSACPALMALKPNLWNFEEQQRLTLTEREFMWFVVAYLTSVGVRRDKIGTTLITERAKAVISGPFRDRLLAIVPNLNIYAGANPGHNARAPYAGQFEGKAKGNFRTKALVEGFFNPLDNQTAMLAGQMGKDREHSPAQLAGQEKYTGQIARRAEAGGVELARLQFPFLTFHQWRLLAHDAVERIKAARDHALEGWQTLGFERVEWRESAASNTWLEAGELNLLADLTRAIIKNRIETDPALTRSLRLSRAEVFQAKRRELKPVPLFHIPELVGRENALNGGVKPLRVDKGLFSFDCEEIEPDTLYFYAKDERDGRGYLPNGSEYLCFVNPCWPQHLIACDDALRVVAVCPRYERAHDEASLHRALGQQNSYEAQHKVTLDLRHDDAAKRQRAMREHNERELGSARGDARPTSGEELPDCAEELLAREDAPEQ